MDRDDIERPAEEEGGEAAPRVDPRCPYDWDHTRYWCGYEGCREFANHDQDFDY